MKLFALILSIFLTSDVAMAQGALLQGGAHTAGHAPMYVNTGNGQTVVQDSGPAGGGGIGVGLNEQAIVARGKGTAPYAGQGTGPLGTIDCLYDAPITNATGYHYFCLSPNAQGGALIDVGHGGPSSALPFNIILNGATYPFPFAISGIVGPSVTVPGNVALWNNGSGTLLKDGGFVPMNPVNNLSELTSASTARTNLGIGTAGTTNTGTSGATVPLNNGGFTQSGAANFTGAFQINGATQTFPGSGLLVGTTDAQTLTGKTISGSSNTLSNIGLGSLSNETANTLLGNSTGSSAAPAAIAIPGCSAANNALTYTTSGGAGAFGCNTITASGTTVYPSSYGAVCNNSTDDTTALNTMYSTMPSGSIVQYPPTLCKATGSINVSAPSTSIFPVGGGITETGTGAAISINASDVSIICQKGAVINGPRTPNTGNDFLFGSYGVNVNGSNGVGYTNVVVQGCQISNFKSAGIWAYNCYACNFSLNYIYAMSYAGILCEPCINSTIDRNYITGISSSNGPANSVLPAHTKTNAYGISLTTDGLGNYSSSDIVSNNDVDTVPTWECFDTHAGTYITFIGNIGTGCRTGIQVTTDGVATPPSYVKVIGNTIICYGLNQPVYPGSANISVGGAGIYVSGVPSGSQAEDIQVLGNSVASCGWSESAQSPLGNIVVGEAQDVTVGDNSIVAGRFNGVETTGVIVDGNIRGNKVNGLVAGPIGTTPNMFYVASSTQEIILSNNTGASSAAYAYYITATSQGTPPGIARNNSFSSALGLYNPSGPVGNRTDLGATPP